jgi:hypothetical protein
MESDEKDFLALRKLTLEIAEMERPWWKRPAYILAALPTLLAIVALSVAFLNGFFGAQLTKLDNQRHDLEAEIIRFEGTRNALLTQNEKLKEDILTRQGQLSDIKSIASRLIAVSNRLAFADPSSADSHEGQVNAELLDIISKLDKAFGEGSFSPGTVEVRRVPKKK